MIFKSLLIHFSDFSRFSGSPSANFRKNREIGRIQTPLRILGEHPWNRRVECESGRFTDFWGFSQAPHQQIETWARFSLEIQVLGACTRALPAPDFKLILSWFWTDFKWFLNHYWFIFLIFQDFQAPHQQISGKIEKSAGSKLHSAFWANIGTSMNFQFSEKWEKWINNDSKII